MSADVIQVPAGGLQASPGSAESWDWPLWSPDGRWLLLPNLALVATGNLGV